MTAKVSIGLILSHDLLDEQWMDESSCKNYPPETFFSNYERGTVEERKDILQICNGTALLEDVCPVKEKCYRYARETRSTGVFGGTYFVSGREHRSPLRFRDKDIGD